MASPVGHLLGAVAVYKVFGGRGRGGIPSGRSGFILPVLLGVLPDLDLVVYLFSGFAFGSIHRGPTHSLLAGVLFSLLFSLFFAKRGFRYFLRTWFVLFLCSLTHPLLDFFMGCCPGVPLFWPFDLQGYVSPLQLIPTAYHSTSLGGSLDMLFMLETWEGVLLEMVSILPLLVAGARRMDDCRVDKITYLMVCISLSGFILTYVLYN